jgi:hypothetical protein
LKKLDKTTLTQFLQELGKRMPLFYSEADFQHSLAILLNNSGYSTRPEKAFYLKNSDESEFRKLELDIEMD